MSYANNSQLQRVAGFNPQMGAAKSALTATGVSPEQVKRDQVESVDFYSFFRRLNDSIFTRQQSLWLPIYNDWIRSAAYALGRQLLVPNQNGFGYRFYQLKGKEHSAYVYNRFTPYVNEIVSKWVNINPQAKFSLLSQDEWLVKQAADDYQAYYDHYGYKHLGHDNEGTVLRIALNAILCGNYHGEIWFNPDAKAEEEYQTEQQGEIPGALFGTCLECGQEWEIEAETPSQQQCPNPYCGSVNTEIEQAEAVPFAIPGDRERRQAGDLEFVARDAWAQRYDLVTGAELSPYRYVEEEVPVEVFEFEHGKLNDEARSSHHADDEMMHGARLMRRMEKDRSYQGAGFNGSDDRDCCIKQRFFYEKEMLAYAKLSAPVTLPDGEVIPANVRLSEVFFDTGVCLETSKGLDRFTNVYRASHRKRFIDGKYVHVLGKTLGRGIEDAREAQRQRNVLRSGVFSYFQKTLQPSIAVDKSVFGGNTQLFNRHDLIIETNRSAIGERKLDDFFSVIQAPPINQQVLLFDQLLESDLQAITQNYDSSTDSLSQPNPTARAATIGAARRAEAPALHFALYAGWRKEHVVRCFDLGEQHFKDLRPITRSEKLSQERKEIYFDTNLLRSGPIIVQIVPGSFLPDLQVDKQEKFERASLVANNLATIGLLNDRTLAQIHEWYGVDLKGGAENEKNEVGEEIFETMLAVFAQTQGMVTAEELFALNPVDPYEDSHEQRLMWWRRLLSSRYGRQLPEQIRQAIRYHIDADKAAIALELQERAMVEIAPQLAVSAAMPEESDNAENSSNKPGKKGSSGNRGNKPKSGG